MRTLLRAASVLLCGFSAFAQHTPLSLVQTIPLPHVEGRIDHLTVDVEGKRLFVAALGNNSVEVIDLEAGKRVKSVANLHEPQGLFYLHGENRLFAASAADGMLRVFDGETYSLIKSIPFREDADNVRFDAASRRVLVGYGDGALAAVDPVTGKVVADCPLGAHPESFQLEKSRPRIFVNVPNLENITVVDRVTLKVTAKWPVEDAKANFPMAVDEANSQLMIGCRKPPKLLVYNTVTGKLVAGVPIVGDTDDVFYDAATRRVYVSGGEGAISVIEQTDSNHYKPLAKIATAVGARTSLFVPTLKRLYVAVPHKGEQLAEIRVYSTE